MLVPLILTAATLESNTGVGAQWELPGRRGAQRPGVTPSVSFSIPPHSRAFCLDRSLGSSNRPFLKHPRVDGSKRGGPGLRSAGDRETAGEPARPNRPIFVS